MVHHLQSVLIQPLRYPSWNPKIHHCHPNSPPFISVLTHSHSYNPKDLVSRVTLFNQIFILSPYLPTFQCSSSAFPKSARGRAQIIKLYCIHEACSLHLTCSEFSLEALLVSLGKFEFTVVSHCT
jgi:hypothetical protein